MDYPAARCRTPPRVAPLTRCSDDKVYGFLPGEAGDGDWGFDWDDSDDDDVAVR